MPPHAALLLQSAILRQSLPLLQYHKVSTATESLIQQVIANCKTIGSECDPAKLYNVHH
jgi:hypothetical protein